MTFDMMLDTLPFLHPAEAGLALLTGLIPILVHLIHRRRFVRVPWAAMSLLQAAGRHGARRMRIEQWLLLLVRMGVIVLFGLAVARPFLPGETRFGWRWRNEHVILMLDNSLSMNARAKDGGTRFDRAKRFATRLVESLPRGRAISLVTLANPASTVMADAAYDRRRVRDQLAAIPSTQRSVDVVGAVQRVLSILKDSPFPPANRSVYLISDFPRPIWEGQSPVDPTPGAKALRQLADSLERPALDLHICPVATEAPENVGVTSLSVDSPWRVVHHPLRITAQVRNHGAKPARGCLLEFRADGRVIRQDPIPPLEPGFSHRVNVTTAFAAPGTHLIEAEVSPGPFDGLVEDDVRYLSVEVCPVLPVLVVDGRPGPTQLTGQAGFLATALAPQAGGRRVHHAERPGSARYGARLQEQDSFIEPKIITASELPVERLSDYAAVILCNVRRIPEESWRQLETFVATGGGLMLFGGDLVSAAHYNRFAYAGGAGLLPGRIGRPYTPPLMSAEDRPVEDRETPAVGFALTHPVHPMVAAFVGHPESGLFSARVQAYLSFTVERAKATVILQYSNGDPALIASTRGRGRVLLWTTTANMDWTNLPAKGDYVSVMMSAVAFLARRAGAHRNIRVGQTLKEPLTPLQSTLPLHVSAAAPATASPKLRPAGTQEPQGLALVYGPVERAGPLTVTIGSDAYTFSANVDPAECDLTVVGTAAFAAALSRPFHSGVDPASPRLSLAPDQGAARGRSACLRRQAEWAPTLFYGVLGLLAVEMWMALRFGGERRTRK